MTTENETETLAELLHSVLNAANRTERTQLPASAEGWIANRSAANAKDSPGADAERT